MAKLMNWAILDKKLKEKKILIFTPLEIRRIFGISKVATAFLMHRYAKKGLIKHLKRGLYSLRDADIPSFCLANKLYVPSYISFDTALSHYGLIPETVYSITSATTKATRQFTVQGINYTYQTLKKEFFTGYRAVKYQGETVLLAEPEKALADYLYFIELKKREFSYERLNLKKIEKTKLIAYVKLFKRPRMINLIKKIYAQSRKSQRIF